MVSWSGRDQGCSRKPWWLLQLHDSDEENGNGRLTRRRPGKGAGPVELRLSHRWHCTRSTHRQLAVMEVTPRPLTVQALTTGFPALRASGLEGD